MEQARKNVLIIFRVVNTSRFQTLYKRASCLPAALAT